MPNDIEILIQARDEASAQLARVQAELERALMGGQRGSAALARQTAATSAELAQAGRTVRVVAGELATTLDPALGRLVGSFSAASGASRGMGLALGSVTVAAAVATTGLSQYLQLVREGVERQAALAGAVRGFRADEIRSEMAAASQAVRVFNELGQPGVWRSFLRTFGYDIPEALGLATSATTRHQEAVEALRKVLPIEREVTLAEIYIKQHQAQTALLGVELQRAAAAKDVGRLNELMMQRQQQFMEERGQARVAWGARERLAIAEAERRGAPPEELALIRERFAAELELLVDQYRARLEAIKHEARTGELALLEARMLPPTPLVIEEEPTLPPSPERVVRAGQAVVAADERALAVERDRRAVLAELHGLTESQRAAIELQIIEADRLLKLEEARGHAGKEGLATFEAQVRTAAVLQREFERLDPVGGLQAGFRDIAEETAALGQTMRSSMHSVARDIQDALAKSLRGEATGRDWAKAFLRTITDEIARAATGQLFGALQRLVGGAGPGPLTTPVNVTGLPPGALATLQAQGVRIVQGPGGQSYAVPITAATMPTPAEMQMLGLTGPEIAAASRPGYGQAALGAAGVGLAAYGAYSAGSAGAGYTESVLSGAASGALAGAHFGPYGAAIGAVVGGLGGYFGAAEGEARGARYQRRAQRQRDAGTLLNEILDAFAAAATLEQAFAQRLRHQHGTQATIGGFLMRVAGLNQAGAFGDPPWSWPPERAARDLLQRLAALGFQPEEAAYERLGSVAEILANQPDAGRRIVAAALQKLDELADVPLSIFERTVGGEVTRRTVMPLAALGVAPGAEPGIAGLQVSLDLWRQLGLEEHFIERLLRELRRISATRDIVTDLTSEDFLEVRA